jgi:hypothetical protein
MQLSAYVAKQVGKKIGLKPILSLDEWDFLSEKLEIGKIVFPYRKYKMY